MKTTKVSSLQTVNKVIAMFKKLFNRLSSKVFLLGTTVQPKSLCRQVFLRHLSSFEEEPMYFDLPYEFSSNAKALGAVWDAEVKRWCIRPGI